MYGLESNIKNGGIPKRILLMMSVVGGLTAANLYYNQPLLEEMRASLGIGEKEANVIMLGSLLVTLRMMPVMLSSFSGTYCALIATVGKIL